MDNLKDFIKDELSKLTKVTSATPVQAATVAARVETLEQLGKLVFTDSTPVATSKTRPSSYRTISKIQQEIADRNAEIASIMAKQAKRKVARKAVKK